MKHQPPTGVVYERCELVLSEMKAWVASFSFACNGIPYDYYFVVGMPQLTERQAYDIMISKQYVQEARKFFLHDVIIAPTIH